MNNGGNAILTTDQIRALPKTELHVHLDCCLSFDVVSKLRPGIDRATYEREFIAPSKCHNLADFLSRIDGGLALMQTERSLWLAVEDLFQQLKRDNVIYAEIRFAPLLHLKEGLTPDKVVKVVERAVKDGIEETGIEARLILCTLRHFLEKQSLRTVELVEDFRGTRVTALDLAADEAGFPLDAHLKAFLEAHHRFLSATAHAGEAKGADSVRETLKLLRVARIGHGVRSIEDPELITDLKNKNIHLEVCPSCNIQVDVFNEYKDHPIDHLYRAGVSVGINTDARTITNITLTEEYERLQTVFGWGKEEFLQCNRNALNAAFISDAKKKELEKKLTDGFNAAAQTGAEPDPGYISL